VTQVTTFGANAATEPSKLPWRSSETYSSTNPYLSLPLSQECHSKDSVTLKGTGEKAVSIIKADEFAGEYKLSVVNDSGVYLPPSPTEEKSFWGRCSGKDSPIDRTSMDDPFTISRESCEGYRRSFDISARSPVIDSSRSSSQFGSSNRSSIEKLPKLSTAVMIEESTGIDDEFEEIKLDGNKPKKRSIFARFGGDSTTSPARFTHVFKKDSLVESVHESELKNIVPLERQGIQLAA